MNRRAKLASGFDLPGQGSRKNPFNEQACRFGSGGIETDLIAATVENLKAVGGQAQVAPGFEQAKSDILERAKADGEGFSK